MYAFSYNSHIKCFRTNDVAIFSCFGMWNSCQSFVRTFQLHLLYFLNAKDLCRYIRGNANLKLKFYFEYAQPNFRDVFRRKLRTFRYIRAVLLLHQSSALCYGDGQQSCQGPSCMLRVFSEFLISHLQKEIPNSKLAFYTKRIKETSKPKQEKNIII
jgi:hypothetical protein